MTRRTQTALVLAILLALLARVAQADRGAVGQNLSYLKPQSGRVLINAGAQGELPVQKPAGLQWQVLIGPKGSRAYDGEYIVKADEAVTFSVVNSPARITAPGVVTLTVPRDDVSPQINLLFPGRTELPPGIMVLRPGYTEAQAREQVFTSEYIAMLRRFNPGVIRAMDWQRTNGSTVTTWDSRCKPQDALWGVKGKGGPIEPVIDLCNALNADLWVCVPHQVDDGYVRELAALCRAKLKPGLRVYCEYSNEVWNTSPGFPQTAWVKQQAAQAGIPYRQWYAKRTSEIAAIFKGVFADQPERVVVMLAGQTGDSSVLRESLAFGYKPDAVATGGYFNAPAPSTGGLFNPPTTQADTDAWFAAFAQNARAVYAGQQIAKFNALAATGPYRKLIYEWTGAVEDPELAQSSRVDPQIAGVYLAAGAGIFGNGFEVACNFVPLSDAESKYGALSDAAQWNAKAQSLADLSAAHPHPTLIELKPDPRIAELQAALRQSQAERDAAQQSEAAARAKINAARQALQD